MISDSELRKAERVFSFNCDKEDFVDGAEFQVWVVAKKKIKGKRKYKAAILDIREFDKSSDQKALKRIKKPLRKG